MQVTCLWTTDEASLDASRVFEVRDNLYLVTGGKVCRDNRYRY